MAIYDDSEALNRASFGGLLHACPGSDVRLPAATRMPECVSLDWRYNAVRPSPSLEPTPAV
jgi:hypothetical protein